MNTFQVGQYTNIVMDRTVSLSTIGCMFNGIIMHELLHTLGFFHEQSRSDRDSYIVVNTDNIQTGKMENKTQSLTLVFLV